jgi:ADP-heptose:LPS heptosyltransferase
MRKVVFRSWQSPGDVVVSTIVFRELQTNYPNKFILDVLTPYPEIFYNNPRITNIKKDPDVELHNIFYYPEIKNVVWTGNHVSDGYITDISEKLKVSIKKVSMFPEIFLTDEEKTLDVRNKYGIEGNFWLFNAGIKNDMPLKAWPINYWKQLIKMCSLLDIQLIQVGSVNHIHPEFEGVKSLIGKTEDLREYITLCYHSHGHIGGMSLHSHIMAAFGKPCIVIAGGRENPRWEYYPGQIFLHRVGLLDCCLYDGCWFKKREQCKKMEKLSGTNLYYPKCMILISPNIVMDTILRYFFRFISGDCEDFLREKFAKKRIS